jgi:hypothetical protein
MRVSLVLRIERGSTINKHWRTPGEIVEVHHIEEARALVRHRKATPANLATVEALGDCRTPKQRAASPRPAA